ncbi:MAG: DUF3124 domain-containing protein [Bacteroidales bacterium]|nr:DUF3124 domain-containing protein [Bacteroidales bacterium]
MKSHKIFLISWIIFVLLFSSCMPEKEEVKEITKHIQTIVVTEDLDISVGQMVYVPAYSQIYSVFTNTSDARINLAVTLSIRNTDIDNPIIIKSVSYYGDDGTKLKEYVETPFQLSKMASVSFNISKTDVSGGIGANFIVEWAAEQSVTEPYIQAIMIGLHGTQGFSWRNPGYVIKKSVNN